MPELKSERIVLEAPMSFAGSAKRIWRISGNPAVKYLVLLPIIAFVWCIVVCWYMVLYVLLGIIFIPWRLLRRSQRKNKQQKLQHRELLDAIANKK